MSLADEKYLAFTTTRKSGERVSTPVWVVALGGGRAGFYTSSTSGKVKRLRHTPVATVQPSDARGNVTPGSAPVDVQVTLIEGPEVDRLHSLVRAKYGAPMVFLTSSLAKVGGLIKRRSTPYGDVGVTFDLP